MAGCRIRVFLLDDHELVRRGVRAMLSADEDIGVVGEASSVAEALMRIPLLKPDVAVLDVRLPDGSGIDVCREIRFAVPEVRCIMLTSLDDERSVFEAAMAGASGYLLKQLRGTDLAGSVRSVAAGESLLDPHVLTRFVEQFTNARTGEAAIASLTRQESRVVRLIGEGFTNHEIARRMLLGEHTVNNHVSSVLAKLDMTRPAHAAGAAGNPVASGRAAK